MTKIAEENGNVSVLLLSFGSDCAKVYMENIGREEAPWNSMISMTKTET
jgi:hypothetical protein